MDQVPLVEGDEWLDGALRCEGAPLEPMQVESVVGEALWIDSQRSKVDISFFLLLLELDDLLYVFLTSNRVSWSLQVDKFDENIDEPVKEGAFL